MKKTNKQERKNVSHTINIRDNENSLKEEEGVLATKGPRRHSSNPNFPLFQKDRRTVMEEGTKGGRNTRKSQEEKTTTIYCYLKIKGNSVTNLNL